MKLMFHGLSTRNTAKALHVLEMAGCRIVRVSDSVVTEETAMFAEAGTVDPLILAAGPKVPDILRRLRKLETRAPLLVIAEDDTDASLYLDAGADDVVRAPFTARELLSRMASVARRISHAPSGVVSIGDLSINISGHDVRIGDVPVAISSIERRILGMMAMNHPRITQKASIYQTLYGLSDQPPHEKVIDSHIHNIRRKIVAIDGAGRNFIKTVVGVGYEFCPGS